MTFTLVGLVCGAILLSWAATGLALKLLQCTLNGFRGVLIWLGYLALFVVSVLAAGALLMPVMVMYFSN